MLSLNLIESINDGMPWRIARPIIAPLAGIRLRIALVYVVHFATTSELVAISRSAFRVIEVDVDVGDVYDEEIFALQLLFAANSGSLVDIDGCSVINFYCELKIVVVEWISAIAIVE